MDRVEVILSIDQVSLVKKSLSYPEFIDKNVQVLAANNYLDIMKGMG